MKSLKPSHREKKRYLLLENADKKEVEKLILDYTGALGYSKASPKIVARLEKGTILSVNRKELDKVRAAFLLSGKIKIRKVSGSLKKLKP